MKRIRAQQRSLHVVSNPVISGGEPIIAASSLLPRATDLLDRIDAGDEVAAVAADFGVDPGSLELLVELRELLRGSATDDLADLAASWLQPGFEAQLDRSTVGGLRQALAGLDSDVPIEIEVAGQTYSGIEVWSGHELDEDRSDGQYAVYRRRLILRASEAHQGEK